MRVALVTAALSKEGGGLSAAVLALASALSRLEGAKIEVIGTGTPDQSSEVAEVGPAIHSHRRWGPRTFSFAPGVGSTLGRLNPDVVDVQGLWTYPSLASLRHFRRKNRAYVVTPHGMLDPWARQRSHLKKAVVRTCFEDAHLGNAACLRATAEMEAGHFRSFGLRQPIAVVPNGVDIPSTQALHEGVGPRRLLFLSRIHPKKGLSELLKVWGLLQKRYPDWELVIAGPDELGHTAEMKTLAASLDLERVRWLPAVQGQAKDELYDSASAFVLPTHAENFGLVVAEALAHGVPAVTTKNAPWDGIERHGCGHWVTFEPKALLEALDDIMGMTDAQRAEMGRRGRSWMARDFGWASVARQMIETYRWVLAGGPPPDFVLLD